MGRLWIRMPPGKNQPAHWALISSNLSGPTTDGQLKLKMNAGQGAGSWAQHVAPDAPYSQLLQLRDRSGRNWFPACWMSTQSNFYSIEYTAAINPGDYTGDSGWTASHRRILNDDSGPFEENTGTQDRGFGSQVFTRVETSGSLYRSNEEYVGFYGLPVGMFLDAAETQREITRINNPGSWATTAQLFRVEVTLEMIGYSVSKNVSVVSSNYYQASSNYARLPGRGTISYLGPLTYKPAYQNPDGQFVIPDNNSQIIVVTFNSGVYNFPAPRGIAFTRDTAGSVIWAGDLNNLGWPGPNNHGIDQPSGGPATVTHLLDVTDYDPSDTLLYHCYVSALPDPAMQPRPGTGADGNADENIMRVGFRVRIVYAI